ncbi:MAG: response regulator [Acidobacteria bacterium]|nr:response regulator [Acidobacteriota bacterium]
MPRNRILIVEDETIVAMDLAATLRRLGYEVVGTTGTGASAVEMATRDVPDLVLMDIRLKGPMDGIEAATLIRQRRPVPVVFLTAHGDLDTVERSKKASPHGYLVKPFDEKMLQRAVEIALSRAVTEHQERTAALDALWKSEERFRLLLDAAKDYALIGLDRDGRIVSWNSGAERMTGYSEDEAIGKPGNAFRPPNEPGAGSLEDLFAQVLQTGGAEWDDAGARKDGSRYLAHVYCTPMYGRSGEHIGYAAITRDVTEKRSLEAQLAQAQRLESLGQLAGGIAHDFNNMLMVIFARCDILLRSLQSEKERQQVHFIRAAAAKNRDLTQQLLAAARQQVLEPQIVNVNAVVSSVVQLLGSTLGEHIAIRQELFEPLWNIHVDPGKVHQVIMNLAINARDAMPDGGTLIIETRNVYVDSSYAHQHIGLRRGDYVSIVVSDTGSGIPPEIRDRIFDPFFTTKGLGKGTGLGLAVVRGIIEQSGGQTWVYSEENRGTTFKIFLPRHFTEAASVTIADDGAGADRGSETILLVEDEELLRSVVREALEEHGYRVLEARTPADAMTISDHFDGTIELLLSDVIMPGMTGKDVAAAIAAKRPGIRIVFMSGYTNQAVMNHTALPAKARYLEKPISTNVLLRTVRESIEEANARGSV